MEIYDCCVKRMLEVQIDDAKLGNYLGERDLEYIIKDKIQKVSEQKAQRQQGILPAALPDTVQYGSHFSIYLRFA